MDNFMLPVQELQMVIKYLFLLIMKTLQTLYIMKYSIIEHYNYIFINIILNTIMINDFNITINSVNE